MDAKLIAIIAELFAKAEPKLESDTKVVPSELLDRLSERMAELGLF